MTSSSDLRIPRCRAKSNVSSPLYHLAQKFIKFGTVLQEAEFSILALADPGARGLGRLLLAISLMVVLLSAFWKTCIWACGSVSLIAGAMDRCLELNGAARTERG